MLKILKYLKKYWYFALLAPICMIFEVMMDMVLTNYMQKLVDEGITPKNLEAVTHNGIMMIIIVAIGVCAGILSGVFANLASQKFGNDLRKDLFKKIMSLSYEQTDKFSTGSLITRVTNDVTTIQNMIAMAIRMFVRCTGMFILGIIFTLRINLKFGYVLLIILPIEVAAMAFFMIKAFPEFPKIQKKLDKVNTVVHENLTGIRVVKAFTKEDYENKRFSAANEDYANLVKKVSVLMAFISPIFGVVIYGATLAIYLIGGRAILDGFASNIAPTISIGQISQAMTYITMICFSFVMIGMTFSNLARSYASVKRINEVMDCKLEIEDGNLDLSTLKESGTVEFKNVSFKYPTASGPVLTNINLKINKGDTIAIVGSTGCGKSSLVNLISRFYDVTDGELLVDGVNVKEFKQHDLREKIAIVLQKAELFAGTIKENVLWGKENATDEEVVNACRIAQAEEFIETRPNRYEEYVEEKGTSLSGGQKQRLSIARAIVKTPEIMIFDDATSALDLVTEAELYKAMKEHIGDVTKIVVTQRVATAKNANKVVVIDNGTILAFDTHDVLLETCPLYKDIYDSQLKKEGVFNED